MSTQLFFFCCCCILKYWQYEVHKKYISPLCSILLAGYVMVSWRRVHFLLGEDQIFLNINEQSKQRVFIINDCVSVGERSLKIDKVLSFKKQKQISDHSDGTMAQLKNQGHNHYILLVVFTKLFVSTFPCRLQSSFHTKEKMGLIRVIFMITTTMMMLGTRTVSSDMFSASADLANTFRLEQKVVNVLGELVAQTEAKLSIIRQ